MVFFPLGGVLRGFSAATYNKYVSPQTPARHRERSGEAGGLVRLVEHINAKNQDVKSRRMAGLIEKIAHFQIGN
jgi:hypothetical protein